MSCSIFFRQLLMVTPSECYVPNWRNLCKTLVTFLYPVVRLRSVDFLAYDHVNDRLYANDLGAISRY
jgi:hypothetical protein